VNVNVVTEDRTQLSERAINGIRMVKDAITFFDPKDNKPQNIPFTTELTTAMKTAHKLKGTKNSKCQYNIHSKMSFMLLIFSLYIFM
jgi:hypothetical protein